MSLPAFLLRRILLHVVKGETDMRRILLLRNIAVLVVIVCFPYANEKANALQGTGSFSKSDIRSVIGVIRDAYSIRTGVEVAANDPDNTPINLDLAGSKVPALLSSLVAQRPMYKWTTENDWYDVYPASGSLSEVRVGTFVLKDASRWDALAALDSLPEVRKWLSDHHATRSDLFTSGKFMKDPTRVTMTMTNVSFRTILNEMVKAFGTEHWSIVRYGDKMQYLMIDCDW
jgi:hypothetical protein